MWVGGHFSLFIMIGNAPIQAGFLQLRWAKAFKSYYSESLVIRTPLAIIQMAKMTV